MSQWSEGYVTDITYTYGYYGELNPLRARWALARAGVRGPEVHHACELGFGQGMSINLHAAASGVHWCGTDFNPSQVAFAQGLARASGAHALLSDEAFESFCTRTDLPDFDYIGLHGIWSWISPANMKNGTALGILAKSYIDKGELVPDQVTTDMLIEEVKKPTNTNGFIFDMLPVDSTVRTAEVTGKQIKEWLEIDSHIHNILSPTITEYVVEINNTLHVL